MKHSLVKISCFAILMSAVMPISSFAQTILSDQGQKDFSRVLSPQSDRVALEIKDPLVVRAALNPASRILTWNELAMQLTAVDHARGPTLGYDQLGPHRSSRAIAIVHIAMFDAVNSITRKYKTYRGVGDASPRASIDMAIARAAYDTLSKLYPGQKDKILDAFLEDTARIGGSDEERALGNKVGEAVAANILAARSGDGSSVREPDVGTKDQADAEPDKFVYLGKDPGVWQPDPISNIRVALGYHWGEVQPFAIKTVDDYALPAPPALTSAEYTNLYNETKSLGGDSAKMTETTRKPFETTLGLFWAYDGTPGLCAPPRLYNELAIQVAEQNIAKNQLIRDPSDLSRYLALINVAMADTAIAAWHEKWRHHFWRPVTAITSGVDDGNPATISDSTFYPLGAPATNARGPNFTPPFPAYPSGHAAFGGALFEVLRETWGENTSFSFVSDEFNGRNRGTEGVRPLIVMNYTRFSQPEWENARSRIWLGIHWQIDADSGINMGNAIGKYVMEHEFQPNP